MIFINKFQNKCFYDAMGLSCVGEHDESGLTNYKKKKG